MFQVIRFEVELFLIERFIGLDRETKNLILSFERNVSSELFEHFYQSF